MNALGTNTGDKRDLVYAVNPSGHRQSYLDFFATRFALTPVHGAMSVSLLIQMARARKLLFATLDDDILWFIVIVILRTLLFKPTAALFLRPQKCFETGKRIYRLKRMLFQTMRLIPKLQLITITPFKADPRLEKVAHRGILDPQYFDMLAGDVIRPPAKGDLAHELTAQAGGRVILCFPGSLTKIKGFSYLTKAMATAPDLQKTLFVVCAGSVEKGCEPLAETFQEAGGHLIDRRITDEELENLYAAAHFIWCCYAPDYDQASGIFGRAMQWQVPAILRKHSTIESIAEQFSAAHIAVENTDPTALAETLRKLGNLREQQPLNPSIAERMLSERLRFDEVIKDALEGRRASN
ncbi:MAG: hypothetical protein AAGF28_09025 [Pseudomonadota bacterium]